LATVTNRDPEIVRVDDDPVSTDRDPFTWKLVEEKLTTDLLMLIVIGVTARAKKTERDVEPEVPVAFTT
jgi:hypothetical protein